VAYNIYFDSADVAMVRAIAREIRAASGGLKGVRAMGALCPGRAQLAMNITDLEATPLSKVFRTVSALALRHKAAPVEGEVIGLLPESAYERDSEWMRQLIGFDPRDQDSGAPTCEAPMAWPEGT
jgi:glutamate formiminotransferase